MSSPHGLLQEQLNKDPWKIFVCCIFCNLTKRVQAEPIFWETLRRWPTPEKLAAANYSELVTLVSCLGLSTRRAKYLKEMSEGYTQQNWKSDPTILKGIGKYGADAYKIFCTDDWKSVSPTDHALVNYQNWLIKIS